MELTRAIEYFVEWSREKYTSKTVEIYASHLKRFVAFTGNKAVEQVDLLEDVVAYKRRLERTGLRDNTVNLAMIALRQMWKMLFHIERRLGVRLPFTADAIPVKNLVVARSHRPISEEECTGLLEAIASSDAQPFIRARDLAIFSMLYDTGLRVSELTSLNVSNLDLSRRSAEVVTRKRVDHFKHREVYWTLETHMTLLNYLDRRREVTTTDVLFINLQERERLNQRSIQRSLKTYLKAAGLDPSGISPHSFRHSVGKRAAMEQMYPPLLQSLLGHRNPNSSQVYYNVSNEALRHEYHTKLGDMRTEKVLKAVSGTPPRQHAED